MLYDLIMDLLTASDSKEKEQAYRRLEKVGVDRRTADVIVKEFTNGCVKEVRSGGGPEY